MPTKRRKIAPVRLPVITPAAITAGKTGDNLGLLSATGTKPWQPTPWPLALDALGCDEGACPLSHDGKPYWQPEDWRRAQALQRALYQVAGPPPAKLRD